jgi:mannan endo-1,4-beta-mannosidase
MVAAPNRRSVLRGGAAVAAAVALPSCASEPPYWLPPPAERPWLAHPAPTPAPRGGLAVVGGQLRKDGKPFVIAGMNHWCAGMLARDGNAAGWDQLRRDLDALQAIGVNTLRVMAASEGPDTEPMRVVPSLQPAPGQYDQAGIAGLLKLVEELDRRNLHAVLILNNFWPWSGGMAQYLAWAGEGPIPYPAPVGDAYPYAWHKFISGFYANDTAREAYRAFIRYLVPQLKSTPAVIWELANGPRTMDNRTVYRDWLALSAELIKSLAPGQLVTTGGEGTAYGNTTLAGTEVALDNDSPHIDLVSCHVLPDTWGTLGRESRGFDVLLRSSLASVKRNADAAANMNKPLLIEAFGHPRDGGAFAPGTPTTARDRYFDQLYALCHDLQASGNIAGAMPWTWAGGYVSTPPGKSWRPGEPLGGDPPVHPQGYESIYGGDTTVALIKRWNAALTLESPARRTRT